MREWIIHCQGNDWDSSQEKYIEYLLQVGEFPVPIYNSNEIKNVAELDICREFVYTESYQSRSIKATGINKKKKCITGVKMKKERQRPSRGRDYGITKQSQGYLIIIFFFVMQIEFHALFLISQGFIPIIIIKGFAYSYY